MPLTIYLFFQFPYFFFFSLTTSATSSFHYHVSLCLHGPFDVQVQHVTCAVSIIIFLICCQCSFTSKYFHSAYNTLSLTMLCYSSHVCSSLSFHTHTLGSNFLRHLFVILNHVSTHTQTCTIVLMLFWNLSGTTRVSRYQKGKTSNGKTNLDLLEQEIVSGSGICWPYASLHLAPDNHANISPISFLQGGCPSCHPTNSVKALKASSKH